MFWCSTFSTKMSHPMFFQKKTSRSQPTTSQPSHQGISCEFQKVKLFRSMTCLLHRCLYRIGEVEVNSCGNPRCDPNGTYTGRMGSQWTCEWWMEDGKASNMAKNYLGYLYLLLKFRGGGGYLEEHPQDFFQCFMTMWSLERPLRIELWDPFQMAELHGS